MPDSPQIFPNWSLKCSERCSRSLRGTGVQKGRRMKPPLFYRRSPSKKWRLSSASFTSGGRDSIVPDP